MRTLTASAIVVAAVLAGLPVSAQQVEIEARKPALERPARVVPPPLHYESTRPPDAEFYPQGTKVEHDPAFIEPFAVKYQTPNQSGRFGLSGWTAPNPPVGPPVSGHRDVSGWFALGFSITWDGPPAPAKRSAR